MPRLLTLNAEAHIGRVLTQILSDVRELLLQFRIREISDHRQVVTRTIRFRNPFLIGCGGLEKHVGKFRPDNATEQD